MPKDETPKDGTPKDETPYEVGYGKPPKSSQFEKGKSGNPKGRPKGSKNLANIVLRESRRPVRVNGPGGSYTVTKAEAAVMQLGTKAAQGDLRATREYLPLIQWSEEVVSAESAPRVAHESDQQVMRSVLRRMQNMKVETVTSNGGEE